MDPLARDVEKEEPESEVDDQEARWSQDNVSRAFSTSPWGSSSSVSTSQVQLERDYMAQIQTASSLRGSGLGRYPTAASRIATQKSQHSATVGAAGLKPRAPGKPLPEFGAGKPYPPLLPEKEDFVVEFSGPDDPLHPQNWPTKKK